MTTTDQSLSLDDVLDEPIRARGWVIGPVLTVDQARRQCQVANQAGENVTVTYRPEDAPSVLSGCHDRDEQLLKAVGLCEYQPGFVLTRMLQVERLDLIGRHATPHLSHSDIVNDLLARQAARGPTDLPPDLAENHDEYIARAIFDE